MLVDIYVDGRLHSSSCGDAARALRAALRNFQDVSVIQRGHRIDVLCSEGRYLVPVQLRRYAGEDTFQELLAKGTMYYASQLELLPAQAIAEVLDDDFDLLSSKAVYGLAPW